ncbi:MAG: hypothetical protein HC844_07910 [Tabrizicola sp.]|nr:hypothetical protein [Tabrizicola sp.]
MAKTDDTQAPEILPEDEGLYYLPPQPPGLMAIFLTAFLAAAIPAVGLGYWVHLRLGGLGEISHAAGRAEELADRAWQSAQSAESAAEHVLHALVRDRALPGDDPQGRASLYDIMPIRVFEAIDAEEKLGRIAYSEYAGDRWVFLTGVSLDVGLAKDLRAEMAQKDIRLVVDGTEW